MRGLQEVSAYIMAVALAATGCSGGSTGTKAPAEPAKTEAAGEAEAQVANGEATGEEDPVLVVYMVRSEALNNVVIPGPEKDMDVEVEVVVTGTGELLRRAQSEKDNPLGNIFWVTNQTMLSASKDLFIGYISSEDGNMLEAFRNTTGYFTPASVDPTVMIVNKNLKGDMKIDGSENLPNPELEDKIAFGSPVNSGSVFQSLPAILYGMGEGGDPLSDQAWDYVGQFAVNLDGKMCNSSSQIYRGVVEGEYAVGLTWEGPAANHVKEGAAIRVVSPGGGVMFPGESVQILKDYRYPENAKKFVNYMLPKKIQNVVGPNLTAGPFRKDVKLADCMTPQFEIKLLDNYDKGWVVKHETEITNLFGEHMKTSMD